MIGQPTEPRLRTTLGGTKVVLVEEHAALPQEHVLLLVIVHPGDVTREYRTYVRGDALVPPYLPVVYGAKVRHAEQVFVMPICQSPTEKEIEKEDAQCGFSDVLGAFA